MAQPDFKTVTTAEWGVIGGALVGFIGLFFHAYGVSFKGDAAFGGLSAHVAGWHFAGLWLPVFMVIIAAALVAVRRFRADLIPTTLPVGTRIVVAGVCAIASLIVIIRVVSYPGQRRLRRQRRRVVRVVPDPRGGARGDGVRGARLPRVGREAPDDADALGGQHARSLIAPGPGCPTVAHPAVSLPSTPVVAPPAWTTTGAAFGVPSAEPWHESWYPLVDDPPVASSPRKQTV